MSHGLNLLTFLFLQQISRLMQGETARRRYVTRCMLGRCTKLIFYSAAVEHCRTQHSYVCQNLWVTLGRHLRDCARLCPLTKEAPRGQQEALPYLGDPQVYEDAPQLVPAVRVRLDTPRAIIVSEVSN